MTISISGTVYSDEGVTPILDGVTLNCSINGAASSGSTTSSVVDGTYTISGLTAAAAAVVTVYIQDGVNTQKAVTVTRSTGSSMTGIDLYQDHLNIRSDDGTAFSGTNMNTSDNNGATGISAIYGSASNTALAVASGKHLLIMAGQTYSPGGVSTIIVTGNWINNGTFTSGGSSSTVTLNSTSGTATIKTNGSSFNMLTINGSGGTYTLQDNLTCVSTTTLTAGTLDVSVSNRSVNCKTWTVTSGIFIARSGTVTITSGSIASGGSSFFNLTLALSITLSNNLTVTGALNIGFGCTTNIDGNNLVLSGATFTNSGTFQLQGRETLTGFTNDIANGGLVSYTGSGTTTYTTLVAGNLYANLRFSGTGRTWQPDADVIVNGNLTVSAGTLDMSSANKNISVAGNWSNAGTFASGTGTVTLNGTAQTIIGNTTFYNLVASTTGDVITFTDGTTQTVTNSVTFQHVTLQGSSTAGWTIAMPATQTIDHAVVSHSTATGNTAVAGATSTDGGSNVNWTFETAAAALIGLGGLSGLSGLSSVA